MDKLLVHCCCAPDALYSLSKLKNEDRFDVAAYFYNPNIFPDVEYRKRFKDMERVAAELGVPLHNEGYDQKEFLQCIQGHEHDLERGYRCALCFDLRLNHTAMYAKNNGFDAFTTVITVSPHKSASLVRYFGHKNADEVGTEFVFFDFKKGGGFQESVRMSKKMKLYRQRYCGCEFSI